ncbi:hypothetical protein [Vibrio parahaemolyticus]|uniref:hypothetical protein n=1 Tax=Vibrio parahaemolyticus TaxID=670 RepID=UPI00358DBEAB
MSSQKHTDINPKHSALGTFFLLATNAQLRGEARNTNVTAWHFNTETTAYQKCHAC